MLASLSLCSPLPFFAHLHGGEVKAKQYENETEAFFTESLRPCRNSENVVFYKKKKKEKVTTYSICTMRLIPLED